MRQRLFSLGLSAMTVVAAGWAQAADLGADPTECEIQAALLGAAGPGCPVPRHRDPPPAPSSAAAGATAPAPPTAPEPQAPLSASFLVTFAFNSADIAPESRATLDRVAMVMASPAAGTNRFRIVGHTDAVGGDGFNLALSLKRATAVRDYFVKRHGVAAARLEVEGRGRSRLADPAHPTAAVNRRVEIVNLGN